MRTEGERARASLVEVVAAERSASSELEIMRASLTRVEERLTTLLATSSEDAAHVEALAFELSATRAHLAAAKKRLHDFETVRTDADEASRREDALRAELEAERAQTARHERRSRAELETERVALEEKEECIRSSAAELETARAALHRVRAESAQHAEAMSAAAVRLSVERQG
jgi:chromosome segregation ATPase